VKLTAQLDVVPILLHNVALKHIIYYHNNRTNVREISWEGLDWMRLAEHKDQWQAFVNTIMNLWVP
jgi:hypothetical protein